MKFTSAVVILALAVAVQGSVLPLPYASWASPWGSVNAIHAIPSAISHSNIVQTHIASPWGIHAHSAAPWGHGHAHALVAPVHAVHAHAHAVVAPVHGHEASYVAANRGSVHVAPLPGHLVSQQSLNLSPAPGTW